MSISAPSAVRSGSTVHLSLGSGGVRGMAHVAVVEALAEMGVGIASVTGSSVGAVVGALACAGFDAAGMRGIMARMAPSRGQLAMSVIRAGALSLPLRGTRSEWSLVDGRSLLAAAMPAALRTALVEALPIPLTVVATDLVAERPVDIVSGPVIDAIAASAAIPGLMRPVRLDGRAHVDGGVLDPVPVRVAPGGGIPVVAVDLSGETTLGGDGLLPHAFANAVACLAMMERAAARSMLAATCPDLVLRPEVGRWKPVDFHRSSEIAGALAPFKDECKRAVHALFEARAHG